MATGSGAFGAKGGYNQSGGGYLYVISAVTPAQLQVYAGGAGSGGATTVGAFTTAAADINNTLPGSMSSLFFTGRILKDMGRTIVSAGRSFRKIQAVNAGPGTAGDNNSSPTFGVNGGAAGTVNPGYATFYIETGREGANADNLPAVVRFL